MAAENVLSNMGIGPVKITQYKLEDGVWISKPPFTLAPGSCIKLQTDNSTAWALNDQPVIPAFKSID